MDVKCQLFVIELSLEEKYINKALTWKSINNQTTWFFEMFNKQYALTGSQDNMLWEDQGNISNSDDIMDI